MARRLLRIRLVILISTTSCVYPLQYQEGDAGAGHKPLIVDSVPAMPGPITIVRTDGNERFTVDVEDRDLEDVIYLRVIRDDYDDNGFIYADTSDQPGLEPTTVRKLSFFRNAGSWCTSTDVGASRLFTVIVSNQEFIGATKELPAGAEFSEKIWVATCL